MIGRRISHYRIEDRLGAGGMGEVFLASDLALGRTAAIKVLPPGFSPELRARLLREAEASGRLQHPAIATFYEAGESDGLAFIAMEYVRGETLRRRLSAGPLPTETALGLVACVLEAMGHAHAAGIIHRDIKPENVMVTGERRAKLLDFGLAASIAGAEACGAGTGSRTRTELTREGTLLGTFGYMAPEQLGDQEVDARADVFSAGALLYEMLAGRPAFPGATPAARIAATLSRDPVPLREVRPELGAVIGRALARERERRYPSAGAFLADLRHVSEGGAIAALPDTLAVVDFENRSGDPADSWIGSGVAESLSADLRKLPGLRLVPRPKVLQGRASFVPSPDAPALDPLDLGLVLGCRWILTGSFQKMGGALRVVMQLTESPTGHVVAVEKMDGALESIFEMQDRLAERTAAVLKLDTHAPAATKGTGDLGAFECYARGRRHWLRMEKGGFDQARELYEQAVALDPSHADALVGLAAVHDMRFTFRTDRGELERAADYARRAIAIDPQHAEAHVWLAYALWRLGRAEEGLETATRGGAFDPGNVYPPYFAACMLMQLARFSEALPLYQRAVALDPKFGFAWLGLGAAHMEVERMDEAQWCLENAVALEPLAMHATSGGAGYLGELLRRRGRLDEARRRCIEGLDAVEGSDHMYRDSLRAVCLCALGNTALDQRDPDAARAAFRQAALHLRGRERTLGGGYLLCQALAGLARAGLGDAPLDEASALFERRDAMNWSWLWLCTEDHTRLALDRAAGELGRG